MKQRRGHFVVRCRVSAGAWITALAMLVAGCPIGGGRAAPAPDAGEDRTVEPGAKVLLVGGPGTMDVDGGVLSLEWTQIGGPAVDIFLPFLPSTWFLAPEEGTLTFQFTIEDLHGRTGSDTVVVRVLASGEDAPPAIIDAPDSP